MVDQTCTQHRGKNGKKQGAGADPHVLSFLGFVEFPLSSRAKRAVFSIFLTLSQVSSVSRAGRAESSPGTPGTYKRPFSVFWGRRAELNSGASGACRHPCGNAELYTYIFLFVSFLPLLYLWRQQKLRDTHISRTSKLYRRFCVRLSIFNFPPDAWSPFRCRVQRPFHSFIWEHVEGSA